MSTNILFFFCAHALLIEVAFSQCYGWRPRKCGLISCGAPALDISATSGSNLLVNSFSTIPALGLSLASENVYEGILAAAGELPFLGTVAVDGVLPTVGVGSIDYGCGNGFTNIFAGTIPAAASFSPAGITAPIAAITPATAIAPAAFRSAYGCGCRL